MGVLDAPVAADVGEQVLRRGVFRGQAGDVEDGLAARVPLAFLLVRGVALDEDGPGCVLEAGAGGGGEDLDGAGLVSPAIESGRVGGGRRRSC